MREGRRKRESRAVVNLAMVVVILLFAYLYFFHSTDRRDILTIDTPHVRVSPVERAAQSHAPSEYANSGPVIPEADGLNVIINGAPYMIDAMLSPELPIRAHFTHSNPEVSKVRMQYPPNPKMHVFYPLNRDVTIELHTSYMRQGVASHSEFLAVDEVGRVYDKIRLVFQPRNKKP